MQPSLPPIDIPVQLPTTDEALQIPPRQSLSHRILHTPCNLFGLIHQYFTDKLPSVDPEEEVTLTQLSDYPTTSAVDDTDTNLFPNESSFCLGHWYWTGGVSKSLQSFKDLVDTVRHTDFDPSDICKTKWDKINKVLGENVREGGEGEWADVDAGWKMVPKVPFHKCMETTGVKEYMAANLHHYSLVNVIKEHITDPHLGSTFHMEPYKLLWWPSEDHPEIRLHSKLYTSDMFIKEHQALQDSPGEPRCNLPHVVVGCMVYSDSTHLMAFGNNHLWPCYFHFGNDTKYFRCRSLCNLCNHVAFFEAVSLSMAYLVCLADFFVK